MQLNAFGGGQGIFLYFIQPKESQPFVSDLPESEMQIGVGRLFL